MDATAGFSTAYRMVCALLLQLIFSSYSTGIKEFYANK
jgi:hypothetical protein